MARDRAANRSELGALLYGHAHTVAPFVAATLRPPRTVPSRQLIVTVPDPLLGSVRLSGRLSEHAGGGALLVVVHGLGGSAASGYALRAAAVAHARGLSVLRINLRGADRRGADFYHAGLTSDLHALLAHDELARFGRVYLLGYSLGGHVVLRFGAEPHDGRVAALAAVCSPLDLMRSAAALDRPRFSLYRRHVLAGLCEMYAAVAARRAVSVTLQRARKIRLIREWDEVIVAPRHGFDGADDYYERVSVAPHLARLRAPALIVHGAQDPMVPLATVMPALERAPRVERRIVDGGHVGFSRRLHLGMRAEPGLESQVVDWLIQHQQAL